MPLPAVIAPRGPICGNESQVAESALSLAAEDMSRLRDEAHFNIPSGGGGLHSLIRPLLDELSVIGAAFVSSALPRSFPSPESRRQVTRNNSNATLGLTGLIPQIP